MSHCPFCSLIAHKKNLLFSSKHVVCFLPKEMEVEGHILLAPKKHIKDIFSADETVLKAMILAIQKLSKHLKNKLGATGVNVLHASGKDAQQSISHLHFHLLPRFKNDRLNLWPHIKKRKIDPKLFFKKLRITESS